MGSRLLWGLATATILLQTCSVCWCKVTVSVKFISFRNTHGSDHEGDKCDPLSTGGCDHYFQICIDKRRRDDPITRNWVSNCEYGNWETLWYHNQNENTFDHDLRGVPNPIDVDISDAEPGVTVRVRVMDHDGHGSPLRGDPDVVDHLGFEYIIEDDKGLFKRRESADPFRKLITGLRSPAVGTSLTIDFSAFCAVNYYKYQGQCTKYCRQSRSDHYGQYECSEDGDKLCFKGWKDESTNCTTRDANTLPDLAPQQGTAPDMDKGLIIGLVLGTVVLILIIVIIVALLLRERRKRKLKEQGTSTAVSTATMGQQTRPGTTDMGTGGSYANPAFFSSDTSAQTDNQRNQRSAHGTQTTNGLSPPPYKVADIPTGGSGSFNNRTYGEQQVGAVSGGYGGGSVENVYDDVGLNKKY